MCKTDRETYEKYWDDIAPFIKFGCLKDQKFAEKMDDYIIYKNLDGKYLTLKDCMDKAKEEGHENQIYYVTNEKRAEPVHQHVQEGRPGRSYPAPQHRQPVHRSSGAEKMRV